LEEILVVFAHVLGDVSNDVKAQHVFMLKVTHIHAVRTKRLDAMVIVDFYKLLGWEVDEVVLCDE